MNDKVYIIFDQNRILDMRKHPPKLSSGQHAFLLSVKIPRSFFQRRFPTVNVEVPDDYIRSPDADVELLPYPSEKDPAEDNGQT